MPSTLESTTEGDTGLFLVALVCPPLAVSSIPGITSADITTNIFLTLLGWIPGVLEAWYLISNPPRTKSRSRVLGQGTRTSYGARQPASIADLEKSRHKYADGHSSTTGSRRTHSTRRHHAGSYSSRSEPRY